MVELYREELSKLSIKSYSPIKNFYNNKKIKCKVNDLENKLYDYFKKLDYENIRKLAELYHHIFTCSDVVVTGKIFHDKNCVSYLLPEIHKVISGDNYVEFNINLLESYDSFSEICLSRCYTELFYTFIFRDDNSNDIRLKKKHTTCDSGESLYVIDTTHNIDFNDRKLYEYFIFDKSVVRTLITAIIKYITMHNYYNPE